MGTGKVEKLTADVTGVKVLELVVEGGEKKDSHSWSIWVEPRLSRPAAEKPGPQ
jgi:hypothetical protein